MDNKEQQEALLKEVMLRHGVALGRDDPIMIMHTINLLLMQDSAAAQQKLLERFKSEMEEIGHAWDQNAKNKAERILNAALDASRDAMSHEMKDASNNLSKGLREAMNQAIGQQIRRSVRVACLNLVASCITLSAALLVSWSLFSS